MTENERPWGLYIIILFAAIGVCAALYAAYSFAHTQYQKQLDQRYAQGYDAGIGSVFKETYKTNGFSRTQSTVTNESIYCLSQPLFEQAYNQAQGAK